MIKSLKPYLIAIALLIVLGLTCELMRRRIGNFAGSYPFAESWNINSSIDSVEIAIRALKLKEPQLFHVEDSLAFEKDPTGYWRKVNFMYDNQLVNALIRENDKKTSLLIFKIINIETGDVKLINRDYDFIQHRKVINKFRKNILTLVNEEVEAIR